MNKLFFILPAALVLFTSCAQQDMSEFFPAEENADVYLEPVRAEQVEDISKEETDIDYAPDGGEDISKLSNATDLPLQSKQLDRGDQPENAHQLGDEREEYAIEHHTYAVDQGGPKYEKDLDHGTAARTYSVPGSPTAPRDPQTSPGPKKPRAGAVTN